VAADLAVQLSAAPLSPTGELTYTAVVANHGPATATGVSLLVTLPDGVINISTTPTACSFSTASGGIVTCPLGTLAAGGSLPVMMVVHPVTTGTKIASAQVWAATADLNPGNNTATASSNLSEVTISDLAVTLANSPDPLRVGGVVTYTATIHNGGDDDAHAVVLSDVLPAGVSVAFITASQGSCTVAGSTVVCQLGTIGNGASATVKLFARTLVVGPLYNTVGVGTSTADPNPANNSTTTRTWVSA
jgi:uncharacterized repeat protein (TIGR01451 family)